MASDRETAREVRREWMAAIVNTEQRVTIPARFLDALEAVVERALTDARAEVRREAGHAWTTLGADVCFEAAVKAAEYLDACAAEAAAEASTTGKEKDRG